MDVNIPGLDKIIVSNQEKKNKMKVDYNLYVKFCSLREFFRNPLQCYKIVWKTFTLYTNDVLKVFGLFKMDGAKSSKNKITKILQDKSVLEKNDFFDNERHP
jgi:hypothetical protein